MSIKSSDRSERKEKRKERFETAKFISKTNRMLHEQRRKQHMRVFFTTITYLASILYVVLKEDIVRSVLGGSWLLFSISVLILIIVPPLIMIGFLEELLRANRLNNRLAEKVENEMLKSIGIDFNKFKEEKDEGTKLVNTSRWQRRIIICFMIAVFLIVVIKYLS